MPVVSIIIPLYNAEKYISQCLDSIVNQSFHDFEVIIVDDGSIDASMQLCQSYLKDCRFKIVSKPNSGVSDARNVGLSLANGEYVTFVDSDDYISSDFLELAVNVMKENSAIDFVQFSIERFNEEGIYMKEESVDICTSVSNFLKSVHFWGSACASLMKLSLIIENHIHFPSELRLGEDQAFVYEYLTKCNMCSKQSRICYSYRSNLSSAIHNQRAADLQNSIIYFRDHSYPVIFERRINNTIFSLFFNLLLSSDISAREVYLISKSLNFTDIEDKGRKLVSIYLKLQKYNDYLAVLITRALNNVIE